MNKYNCGIYKIVNLIDGKIYVGSSSNLKSRKYCHFKSLKENKHKNIHLQRAYSRDGENNFKWEIIERIKPINDKQKLKEILLEREQYYLDRLKIKDKINKEISYNICPIAESCLGRKVSEETREKLSKSNKGQIPWIKGKTHSEETREKLKLSKSGKLNPMYGKNHKEESIIKLKRTLNNMKDKLSKCKGKKLSEEHRNKISQSNKGKSKPKRTEEHKLSLSKNSPCKKRVLNITTGKIFNSIKEAAEFYNIKSSSSIGRSCRKGLKAGGFNWKFMENKNEQC